MNRVSQLTRQLKSIKPRFYQSPLSSFSMHKRELSASIAEQDENASNSKRARVPASFKPIKIASAEAAAKVDANTPLSQLTKLMDSVALDEEKTDGSCVVYWMRRSDLRIRDNKALSRASQQAQEQNLPLVVLFVISPQDYIAHDVGARKIDFMLRNLAMIKKSLDALNIPLCTYIQSPRKTIPSFVLSFCQNFQAHDVYANLEYEVDELRRDIELHKIANSNAIEAHFVHDKCVIEPGVLLTKQDKPYSVYSPYQRLWIATLNDNIPYYLEDCPTPKANDGSIREDQKFSALFEKEVPKELEGHVLEPHDKSKMEEVWPAGEDAARDILDRFLTTKARTSQLGAVSPLSEGFEVCPKNNRINKYEKQRDLVGSDTTSRLSTYLTSGVISARECVRATMKGRTKVDSDRNSGIGRWIQEIAWREFYTNILASFPRVSMGRPYLEKFSKVVWENHQMPQESGVGRAGKDLDDVEMLKKWKTGMTGVPIVDASMRCINEMGWCHNRARMIIAMYLTKDLMIDWRVGERYFMEKLIDGDLSANNGGWQWCASTGVDPCPYFRIFNPYSQSEKVDPTGEFIRHWVPELRKVRGPELHNPPAKLADKLGYPRPMISHNEARERALRRYKNPGEE